MTNPTYALLVSAALIAVIFLPACNTSSQQPEVTHAGLQYVALSSNKEKKDALTTSQNASVAREWEALRDKFEVECRENERRIAVLRARMKRVSTIEQTNKKLKTSIETYQQGYVDWDLFKRAFNSDMQSLAEELKALSGHTPK